MMLSNNFNMKLFLLKNNFISNPVIGIIEIMLNCDCALKVS